MNRTNCCVKHCRQSTFGDPAGGKPGSGLTFYSFPAWRRNEGKEVSELTMRRRAAWVAAVGRWNITFNCIPTSMRVCSRHFHSGKPAYEMLQSDPDWAPSLKLGHAEGSGQHAKRLLLAVRDKKTKKKRERELNEEKEVKKRRLDVSRPPQCGPEGGGPEGGGPEGGGPEGPEGGRGPLRATDRPWREVRSLLLSVLKHPADQTHEEAVHAGKETDFRDFFRESLRASLEDFSKSRTLPVQQAPIYVDLKEDRDLRSSSSSSCVNCVLLQRKVIELREELSLASGGQGGGRVPPVTIRAHRVQQRPEVAQIEETVPDWAEPIDGDPEASSPSSCPLCIRPPSRRQPRPFRKIWLHMFWFLRYSASRNIMWCHVCRLHDDKKHRDKEMVKGTRKFKLDNIRRHGSRLYHVDNVERYTKQAGSRTPGDAFRVTERPGGGESSETLKMTSSEIQI
ncbi:uncharacterized protein LOC117814720 isoform X2 [Notolabrus celidotus]|uniref:uncharacterized protein LOC117814720 isoform X2 n=1 Tax=Notolabrus celidotus TaxID=1203425 RepID=UPI00148FFEE2|nr:uncharacterized protein LOC117814720 isoform X2 [Notolabrus celidotus]